MTDHLTSSGIKVENGVLTTPDGIWDLKSFTSAEVVNRQSIKSPLQLLIVFAAFILLAAIRTDPLVLIAITVVWLVVLWREETIAIYIHGPAGKRKVWSLRTMYLDSKRANAEMAAAIIAAISQHFGKR